MATLASFRFAFLAALVALSSAGSLRRLRRNTKISTVPPLETPNLAGYEPEEVLCFRKDKMQGWCKDWLGCIKKEASPDGTAAAVMAAWKPADCEQMCGKWPVTNKPEGANASLLQESKLNASRTAVSGLLHLQAKSSMKDCMDSCKNFQKSLSSCVATIAFEPGKTAAMGLPEAPPKDVKCKCKCKGPCACCAAPAQPSESICSKKDSPCKPNLEVEHQKCSSHKAKKTLGEKVEDAVLSRCKNLAVDYADCQAAKCPQMAEGFASVYAAFTGGCMDQLNAYHAATNPAAGVAAIPGASGCTVH